MGWVTVKVPSNGSQAAKSNRFEIMNIFLSIMPPKVIKIIVLQKKQQSTLDISSDFNSNNSMTIKISLLCLLLLATSCQNPAKSFDSKRSISSEAYQAQIKS